ncbi:MAG TPA: hypothetical protein VFI31_13635 [Pirellulales bacterium]|nr:hypothetical protein [Pirellulales bacterium]
MNSAPSQNNPFSTRYTRPDAMAFEFDQHENEGTLIARLREFGWWGQIVGPHGSGKSTLLATLVPALEAAGREVQFIALHEGDRRLPLTPSQWQALSSESQLVVDGYEQLGRIARWRVKRHCRRCGCGLLVTSHRDVGLPTLWTMNPRLELTVAIVRRLLPPGDIHIDDRDVEAVWRVHAGNLRETLFRLYDLYEQRRSGGG